MASVIHVHFNSVFQRYLDSTHDEVYDAIIDTVADTTSKIIKHNSSVLRCPQKIDDEIRPRVPTQNILLSTHLKTLQYIKNDVMLTSPR